MKTREDGALDPVWDSIMECVRQLRMDRISFHMYECLLTKESELPRDEKNSQDDFFLTINRSFALHLEELRRTLREVLSQENS